MEANELRIGNTIHVIYMHQKEKVAVNVEIHDLNLIHNKNSINEYSPIELTPAILEECGFEELNHGWYSINYFTDCRESAEVMGIQLNVKTGRCGIFDTDCGVNAMTGKVIKHLHELQNLFRWVTGKELEVNLNERPNTNTQIVL